jgi:sirohydrochlorin cobaltochelatase
MPWPDTALVLCTHGIRGHPGAAIEHAARLQERSLFAEVHACAYRGTPGLAETLATSRARNICLAPLLMAEGFTLRMMLRKVGQHDQSRLAVCRPIGAHPKLAEVMADMAQGACAAQDWTPRETALLVVGHGTVRHPDSGLTARRHAAHIAATKTFREVAVAFLDEPPGIDEALAGLTSSRCVVVGLFIDRGEHGEADIPRTLAAGVHPAIYAGPVGSDPRITDLLLDQVRRVLSPLAA